MLHSFLNENITDSQWYQLTVEYKKNPEDFLTAYQWVNNHPELFNYKHFPGHDHNETLINRLPVNIDSRDNKLAYTVVPRTGTPATLNPTLAVTEHSYEQMIITLAHKLDAEYGNEQPHQHGTTKPQHTPGGVELAG
jgi:hypothetical protein